MAETREIVNILNVDTQPAVRSLRDLRKSIDDAKGSLKQMKEEGDEYSTKYQSELVELKAKQNEYNQTMRLAAKEVVSVKGSYNDLVNQLTILKEEWKQTAPNTAAYDAITAKVKTLKDQLQGMDAEIGNYQRNVGNYQGALQSFGGQLNSLIPGFSKVTQGVKTFDLGLKALAANPVIGVLTALSAVIAAIAKGFKSSEENMNRLKLAMAPFQGIAQGVTNACQKMADGFAKAAQWATNLLDKMNLLSERAKENQALTKAEIELVQQRREIEVQNARIEAQMAEMRMKAADAAHYSEKQRYEFTLAAEKANEQLMLNNIALAEKDLEIQRRRKEQVGNDPEQNERLAKAEAALYQARTAYYSRNMRLVSRESTLTRQITSDTEKQREALVDVLAILSEIEKKDDALRAAREKENNELDREVSAWLEANEVVVDDIAPELAATIDEQIAKYQQYGAAVSAVMGNVAQAWAQNIKAQVDAGKITEQEGEKQFKFIKALQYSQALINTAAGAAKVLSDPSYTAQPVRKWTEFAAVLTAGLAQAMTIRNTQLGAATSAGGSLGAAVKTTQSQGSPAVIQMVNATQTPTGASSETTLNQQKDNRVYLVWSDAQAMENASRVQLQESGF